MKKENIVRMSLVLDHELNEIITNRSNELGISKSALVRLMIKDQLKAQDNIEMLQRMVKVMEKMDENEVKKMFDDVKALK